MERKLMSIQRVISLQPIPEAEKIELASVLGWHVVVQKGLYQVGDLAVYVEVDSELPDGLPAEEQQQASGIARSLKKARCEKLTEQIPHLEKKLTDLTAASKYPMWEFLRGDRFLVRTKKMRGEISQGLLIPLKEFKDLPSTEEGYDLTEFYGIKKWEEVVMADGVGNPQGSFPPFLHKTDETRLQGSPFILKYLAEQKAKLIATEKIDGSSITFFKMADGEFGVCSRNLRIKNEGENRFWSAAAKYDIEAKLKEFFPGEGVALQAELAGPGIQSNRLNLKEPQIFVFNLFYIDKDSYANPGELVDMVQGKMDLPTAPIRCTYHMEQETPVYLFVGMADTCKMSAVTPTCLAEGLVFRTEQEMIIPRYGRASFKVISSAYLLKHGI